jgi:hypothetical protein
LWTFSSSSSLVSVISFGIEKEKADLRGLRLNFAGFPLPLAVQSPFLVEHRIQNVQQLLRRKASRSAQTGVIQPGNIGLTTADATVVRRQKPKPIADCSTARLEEATAWR